MANETNISRCYSNRPHQQKRLSAPVNHREELGTGGKSPVQLVHINGWRRYSFFLFSKQFLSYHWLRRNEMLIWLIFHLFGNLSDNNWRQYHLSILRYFQFNEVSQGWRCLRIRMPTNQVPCRTKGISNLHCALHMHMLTNAKSVVTFEIGLIPW